MGNKLKIVCFLLVSLLLSYATLEWWSYETKDLTVSRVESKNDMYLIYTNLGVFKNEDTWKYLKFNSSDVYNTLSREGEFTCGTYGYRFGLVSMYPNITSCTKKENK